MSFESRFGPGLVRDNGMMTMGTNGILTLNGVPIFSTPPDSTLTTAGYQSILKTTSIAIGCASVASSGSATTAYSNIGIGEGTLANITSGNTNLAIGATNGGTTASSAAGSNLTSGSDNIFIGGSSGYRITSGNNNIIMTPGGGAAVSGSNCSNAIAIGAGAGGPGTQSVVIGSLACASNASTPQNCVLIGYYAAYAIGNSNTAAYVTAIGNRAGSSISTGTNNLVLGSLVASSTLSTGSYNILLGNTSSIDTPASSTSNYLAIGLAMDGTTGENSNTANAGIRSLGYVAEKNYTIQTGSTYTVGNAVSTVIVKSASITITAPAAPVDGQIVKIACATTAAATFSFTNNTGQTVQTGASPAAMTANTGIAFIYNTSGTTWYRLY